MQPTRTAFDVFDRVTSVTIPDNTTTATSYDFTPDRAGRTQFRTTVIDGLGVRKEMLRDVRALIETYDTIHNITRKNQVHQFKNSVQPDTTYDYTFTYPPSGSALPHGEKSSCARRARSPLS